MEFCAFKATYHKKIVIHFFKCPDFENVVQNYRKESCKSSRNGSSCTAGYLL